MKAVDFKTSHILVRAYSTNEWLFCNYAIINVTEEWLERARKAGEQAADLKEEDSFASLSFYEGKTDFYNIEQGTEADNVLDPEKDWSFIEISDEELEDLELVEERLEIHGAIKINGSYFVDYTYRNKDGEEVTHVGLEIEPLELMGMLNNKLNDLLETLNND